MKADKYAEEFMEIYKSQLSIDAKGDKKAACISATIVICQHLIYEIKDIGLARKAYCDLAWEAIFKEQSQKWRAIVRRLDKDRLPFLPKLESFQIIWETFKEESRK